MRHVKHAARMGDLVVFLKICRKEIPSDIGSSNTKSPSKYFDGYRTSVCSVGFILKRQRNLGRLRGK
jgi:hypothetical protein